MLPRTTMAAVRGESQVQYTVKYVVNVRINALYRLELSMFVFAAAGGEKQANSTDRSAAASRDSLSQAPRQAGEPLAVTK
jgi:hypothetical protein